ncbi:hypothetical protein C0991_006107 [Blastosporella zonata]|nr:hypothetical protein C0991_006107 [Blastosporella zonata]
MNARHEAGEIGGGDPWVYVTGPGGDYARRVQPVWVERWIEDPDTAREKEKDVSIDLDGVPERGKWRNIMPLCASLSHPEHETKSETGGDAEKGRRGSVSTVSSWFSNWSTAKPTDTVRDEEHALPEVSTEVLQDPEAKVDIVVMIAMPRGPNSRGYEFGVASVPSNIHKTSGETPTVP